MGCCFEKGHDEYVEISRRNAKANIAENAAFDDEHPKLTQQPKIREKRKCSVSEYDLFAWFVHGLVSFLPDCF